MGKLAIFGGEPTKKTAFRSGPRFTEEEKEEVLQALEGDTLFYFHGEKTTKMEQKMCGLYGAKHAIACSSGTAAVHIAVAALGIGPGDEVLVPSVTDLGSVIGIVYQNAIPVFMDMDKATFNFDIEDMKRKITSRTKAVLAVHFGGNPCNMTKIYEVSKKYNLKVIEDCAQSWHAKYKNQFVGTIGDIGCFSFNDFKHLSTGEGGICITNDDELAKRLRLYTDKCYYRDGSGRKGEFLAPNYRISELCSAVAIGQLSKAEWIASRRNQISQVLNAALTGVTGIYPEKVEKDSFCSYWFYPFRFEEVEYGITRQQFIDSLTAEGIPCGGSHTKKPLYDYGIFKNRNAFHGTHYPFQSTDFNSNYTYFDTNCPNSQELLDKTVILSINEHYSNEDVDDICRAFTKINDYYLTGK